MHKVKEAYEKSVDFILGLAFQFWVWLGAKLDARIVETQQVIYRDSPETQETLARLVAENDELRKSNQQLTWALDGHHGVQPTGPNRPNNNRKLTDAEVKEIRELKRAGWKNVDLADTFDVNRATISRIVRGVYHKKLAVV